MPSITDAIASLRALKIGIPLPGGGEVDAGRLVLVGQFGRNPGDLQALLHVPAGLRPRSALVVVLHGCTQTAAD